MDFIELVIRQQKSLEVKPCKCGAYPTFEQPDYYYTDVWLKCPNCGRSTWNTGGYQYAMEIPLETAKANAIIAWNNGEYKREDNININT